MPARRGPRWRAFQLDGTGEDTGDVEHLPQPSTGGGFVEYIISLFSEQRKADQAAAAFRHLGLSDSDYDVKSHAEYTHTVKGWLERLFRMPEPLSGMEAEGVPHDDARWYEDQIEHGQTMLVVRTGRDADGLVRILEQAGAHDIRRYQKRDEAWTQLTGR